jgi:Putative Actinobacterial Holin-X, holin superfamily III
VSFTTGSTERPFTAVLSSILGNLQDIVRSEVKLAKAEVREEIGEFTKGASWLATGLVSGFFGVGFLLGAAFFALSYLMPHWIAALVISGVLLILSAVCLAMRLNRQRALPRIDGTVSYPPKEPCE